jgi:chromosomal replication initiation ATPase DnaA
MATRKKILISTQKSLLEAIAKHYNVEVSKLTEPNRKRDLVFIKQLFVYIGFKYYDFNKKSLSNCLNQDHTSGLHSFNRVQDLVDVNNEAVLNGISSTLDFLKYKQRQKRTYEKKYDAILFENINLKLEIRKLNNTIEFLKKR